MYVVIHHSNKGVLMLLMLHTTLYTHSEYRDSTMYTLCIQSGRTM